MNIYPKVLVVDDDEALAEVYRIVLDSHGYQVDRAGSKQSALQKIDTMKPDLIVLDIMMDKLTDGFEICYQLKHDPNTREIPVLVISGITNETGFTFSPGTDGEYFEADDYLPKPVKPKLMLEHVQTLLEKRH